MKEKWPLLAILGVGLVLGSQVFVVYTLKEVTMVIREMSEMGTVKRKQANHLGRLREIERRLGIKAVEE